MRHVLAALLLAGCSSSSSSTGQPAGACAAQVGAFTMHFAEGPGGGCGPVPDQIIGANTEGQPGNVALPAGCTGTDIVSGDRCTETLETRCLIQNGNTQATSGALTFAADGKTGSGILQIEVFLPSGQKLCGSVYTVSVTKL